MAENVVDYDDPCALLALMRPAYYALLGGSKAETVKFSSANGQTREVTYARTNITALRAEVRQLESACTAKSSGRSRRFAIRAGGR